MSNTTESETPVYFKKEITDQRYKRVDSERPIEVKEVQPRKEEDKIRDSGQAEFITSLIEENLK
jgi:hypothetical protein